MLDCALEYMDKILFNEKIYKIWDGLIENGGECNEDDNLSKMAASQYNKYLQPGKKNGRPMESLKPAEQGYQVPEPWNGDLEKADILFLSSNPGINVFEKFPRYIGRDKTSGEMRFAYSPVTDAAQADYLSREEVRQFFIRRFQENPYTKSLLPGVYEFKNNGGGCDGPYVRRSVKYWNVMMKIAANILGMELDEKTADESVRREIFSRILSMEMVPFKSATEGEIPKDLWKDCWEDNFSREIFYSSNAKVVFLVGWKTTKMFCTLERDRGINIMDAKTLWGSKERHGAWTYDEKGRMVVAIRHLSGAWGAYDKLMPSEYYTPEIFNKMRELLSSR